MAGFVLHKKGACPCTVIGGRILEGRIAEVVIGIVVVFRFRFAMVTVLIKLIAPARRFVEVVLVEEAIVGSVIIPQCIVVLLLGQSVPVVVIGKELGGIQLHIVLTDELPEFIIGISNKKLAAAVDVGNITPCVVGEGVCLGAGVIGRRVARRSCGGGTGKVTGRACGISNVVLYDPLKSMLDRLTRCASKPVDLYGRGGFALGDREKRGIGVS